MIITNEFMKQLTITITEILKEHPEFNEACSVKFMKFIPEKCKNLSEAYESARADIEITTNIEDIDYGSEKVQKHLKDKYDILVEKDEEGKPYVRKTNESIRSKEFADRCFVVACKKRDEEEDRDKLTMYIVDTAFIVTQHTKLQLFVSNGDRGESIFIRHARAYDIRALDFDRIPEITDELHGICNDELILPKYIFGSPDHPRKVIKPFWGIHTKKIDLRDAEFRYCTYIEDPFYMCEIWHTYFGTLDLRGIQYVDDIEGTMFMEFSHTMNMYVDKILVQDDKIASKLRSFIMNSKPDRTGNEWRSEYNTGYMCLDTVNEELIWEIHNCYEAIANTIVVEPANY